LTEPTKRETLLSDRDVRRWYDNLARGSGNTAEVAIRRLSLFCEQNKTSPAELVRLGRRSRKALEDLIQDQVTRMEKQENSPGYIAGMTKGVKSWLAHNEVELKRRIKVRNADSTPTLNEERVPTRDEMKAILAYSDERVKAAVGLISQAGLRLETLGNESGTDGLTTGDLPELAVKEGKVGFKQVPTIVVVRPELSKSGRKYITFLTAEGCEWLAAYLNKRLSEGEIFRPSTPIIQVTKGYELKGKTERNKGSKFITTRNVSRMIRAAMRPAFKARPYVLRAYFDTQMLFAENHGRIGHPYVVFHMGHVGDIESRYTTNKGRLPDNLVEDMRESFKRCQEYLQTMKPETQMGDVMREFRKQLLAVAGYKPGEIEKMDLESMTDEQMQRKVRTRLVGGSAISGPRQKVIAANELDSYLAQGWEYLDSPEALQGRAIVRTPPGYGTEPINPTTSDAYS